MWEGMVRGSEGRCEEGGKVRGVGEGRTERNVKEEGDGGVVREVDGKGGEGGGGKGREGQNR